MIRALTLVCAATLGLILPARAEESAPKLFAKDTPVVVVGQITSPPKGAIAERKMQVAIGPQKIDYTLHFRNAKLFGLHGQKIDEDGLDDGMWVRAEGRVTGDPRRIEARHVQVIAPDQGGVKRSAFFLPGYDFGYVTSVAGTRQVFPALKEEAPSALAPFVLVGQVSDDTKPFESTRKIQVRSAGNVWTLHVPKEAAVLDLAGKPISVHEVRQGQWMRAYGWRTGDLRMRVERMENVGADAAFTASQLYRKDWPLGYVDLIEGKEAFSALTVTGTVTGMSREWGTLTVRDASGKEHVIYTDNAMIRFNGQPVTMDRVKTGDTVVIEGRTILFR